MYSISRLNLATLSQELKSAFSLLTEPKYRPCFELQNPYGIADTTPIAVGAAWNGQPVGLALACLYPALHHAEMYTLFVSEPHRDRKIGTQLLTLLEQEIAELGAHHISFIFPITDPTTPFLEELLMSRGWTKPHLFGVQCLFDAQTFNPSWLNRAYPFRNGFSLFRWEELTPQEKQKLQLQNAQGVIPHSVFPFGKDEEIREKINSLGLRYNGEVIGWVVTHRIAPDTIRYTAFYLQREFQHSLEGMALLCKAINLHKESDVPWGILELNIAQVDPSWRLFVKKRLVPLAHHVSYTKQSWLTMQPLSHASL